MDFIASGLGDFTESALGDRNGGIPFTLRLWFKYASAAAATSMSVLQGPGWHITIEGGSIRIAAIGFVSVSAPGLFSTSDWNYFAGGFDGSRLFAHLNGSGRAFSPSASGTPTFGPGFQLTTVWRASAPVTDPMPKVDEFAIWKNRVLSEADVTADYNAGAGVDYAGTDPSRLLAYWEMEGVGEPTELIDSVASYELTRFVSPNPFAPALAPSYEVGGIQGSCLAAPANAQGALDFTVYFETTDPIFTFGI